MIEIQAAAGAGNVRAFPNPYREKVSFAISATESGNSSLEIFNIVGQKVSTPFRGYMEKGSVRTIDFNASQEASGALIYRYTNGNKVVTGKIVSMK